MLNVVPTCSSEVDDETRRSRIEGGGNGKLLDLVPHVIGLGDSKERAGGEIGNWIGEIGATGCNFST